MGKYVSIKCGCSRVPVIRELVYFAFVCVFSLRSLEGASSKEMNTARARLLALSVLVPARLADMVVQPRIDVAELHVAVLATARDDVAVLLLRLGRVLEVQRLQVVLEGVAAREHTRRVAVVGVRWRGAEVGLVGVHLGVQLDQRRVVRTLVRALDLVQRHQLLVLQRDLALDEGLVVGGLTHDFVCRRELVLPVALLVADQIVGTTETAVACGALVWAVLGCQMCALVRVQVGEVLVAHRTLFPLGDLALAARGAHAAAALLGAALLL